MGRYFILQDKIGEYLLLPLKHCRLLWTLTSNKIFLHSCRSLATLYQVLIPIAFKSSSASSIQLFYRLPILLFPSILAVTNYFHILSLLIFVICPYHLNLSDSVYFTMSAPCHISHNFVFVLILQLSSSFMEPCIFLTMPFRILKEHSFLLRLFSGLLSPYFKTRHIKVLCFF